MGLDLAIRGGIVLAGPQCLPRRADIGVAGGLIVDIGTAVGAAAKTLDATGRFVAPGFVDIHTHSDFTLPVRPAAEAKLRQGVTTDVTGNCGFSPFPLDGNHASRHHGSFFEPSLAERWPTLAEYAAELDSAGLGINLAPLVGLGAIRTATMGMEKRPPSPTELDTMKGLLATAFEQGAFGASSGLVYTPNSYADKTELAALATVVADYDGLYATHIRNEGAELGQAIGEALDTGTRAGCAVQISHLKALGEHNWGTIAPILEQIEAARRDGQDAWVDVYPYTAGSTSLAALLPPTDLAGGEAALRRRLADANERRRIVAAVAANPMTPLENVLLADVPSRPDLAGKWLVEVARQEEMTPSDFVVALVETDGRAAIMVIFGISEDDVREVLRYPQAIVASDGWAMTTDAATYTHPRSFAYSVRLLAHYVRDEKVLTLSSAIRKLAVLPAQRIGDSRRGTLATGKAADIAVFDLDRLQEVASFKRPCAYPIGIDHVVVGGQVAIESGELTEHRGGKVLNRLRLR